MVGRDSFDAVLTMLRSVKHSGGSCFILFSSPYIGAIELGDSTPLDHLRQQGLSENALRVAVTEVATLVMAVLRDDFEGSLRLENFGRTPTDEERAEHRARYDAVASALVDDHLQRRYQLKRLSKAPAFADIDWDIKMKIADASVREGFEPFPYATLKLSYDKAFEDGASPYPFLADRKPESVQVNFTIDEIEYLMNVLGRARDSLANAEKLTIGEAGPQ